MLFDERTIHFQENMKVHFDMVYKFTIKSHYLTYISPSYISLSYLLPFLHHRQRISVAVRVRALALAKRMI